MLRFERMFLNYIKTYDKEPGTFLRSNSNRNTQIYALDIIRQDKIGMVGRGEKRFRNLNHTFNLNQAWE